MSSQSEFDFMKDLAVVPTEPATICLDELEAELLSVFVRRGYMNRLRITNRLLVLVDKLQGEAQ